MTDTHFATRGRMGCLADFLARILQDGWAAQFPLVSRKRRIHRKLAAEDGQLKAIGSSHGVY